MEYKYTATFEALASIVNPTDQDRFVAKASLDAMRSLLPEDIDPEDSPDLLFFAGNGACAGMTNRNGDAISNETALEINDSAKHKYVDLEHDSARIVGFILQPGLTKFGTNEPITKEQAALLKEPFNMAFSGVIWKKAVPVLAKYLIKNGGATDDSALSLSWELRFTNYSVAISSSNNLFDSEIIAQSDARFSVYDKMLACNGGDGKDPSGKRVSRVILGPAIVQGYGIVSAPAAHVKGILPIESKTSEVAAEPAQAEEADGPLGVEFVKLMELKVREMVNAELIAQSERRLQIIDAEMVAAADSHKNDTLPENPQKASVTSSTPNTMKIENVDQLKAALGSHEATAAAVDFIKSIKEGADAYINQIEAERALVKNAEAAKAVAEEQAKKIATTLAEVKSELELVKAENEKAQAQAKFNERMASFDEEFELGDEERALIASRIKKFGAEDEEGFNSYFSESKVLMSEKSKAAKKKKADDKKGKDCSDPTEPDGDDAKAGTIKKAIASVKEDKSQSNVPNTATADDMNDLAAQMAQAFGGSIKVQLSKDKKSSTSTKTDK